MRTLNSPTSQSVRVKILEAAPPLYNFKVDGRLFGFDPNSLILLLLDNEEEIEQTKNWSVRWAPNWPLYGRSSVRQLVLQACYACNLNCSYCSVQTKLLGTTTAPRMMQFDTAVRAIEMFFDAKQLPQTGQISFFGGEPLLNWPLIEKVAEHFAHLTAPRTGGLHITTNGTLLTDDRCAFLKRFGFSHIVSLDGPPHIHDQLRKKHDGSGSFEDVMAGLNLMRKHQLTANLTLRATFSPQTADSLLERTEYLNGLMYQGFASHVSVEPAFLTESICVDRSGVEYGMERMADLTERMRPLYRQVGDFLVAQVQTGHRPSFHNITQLIKRLFYCEGSPSDCGAGMGSLSVDPEGKVYACHRTTNTQIGSLQLGGIDEAARCQWADNRYYVRERCPTCPIRSICGGGCREESLCDSGNIHKPTEVGCTFKRLWFEVAASVLARLRADQVRAWLPSNRPKG